MNKAVGSRKLFVPLDVFEIKLKCSLYDEMVLSTENLFCDNYKLNLFHNIPFTNIFI